MQQSLECWRTFAYYRGADSDIKFRIYTAYMFFQISNMLVLPPRPRVHNV